MPTERLEYLIEARPRGFVDGMGKAAKATQMTGDQLEDLQRISDKLEADLLNLEKAFQAGLIDAETNAVRETQTLEKALQSMLRTGVDPASEGFQRHKRRLDEMQAGLQGTRGASNRSSLALMDMTRIVEDSAFGIRGMANNINPAIQSFQRLQTETGSTSSAFKAMAGSLMGPGGVMLAIGAVSSLLIAFGPEIKEFFQEAAEEATEFAKATREALESLIDIQSNVERMQGDPRVLGAAILQVRTRLEDLREQQRQATQEAMQNLVGADDERLARLRQQISQQEDILETLEAQLSEYNAQVAASNILKELGFEREATETKIKGDQSLRAEAMKEEAEIAFSIAEQAKRRIELQQRLNKAIIDGRKAIQAEMRSAGEPGMGGDGLSISGLNLEELEVAGARTEAVMADFSSAIAGGFVNATSSLLEGTATFKEALGGFAQSLGQALIGFGIAGIAIKKFITNPIAAIAAGTTLVALGAALKRRAQNETSSFTGATSGVGDGGISTTPFPSNAGTTINSQPQQRVQVVGQVDGRTIQLVQRNMTLADQRAGRG